MGFYLQGPLFFLFKSTECGRSSETLCSRNRGWGERYPCCNPTVTLLRGSIHRHRRKRHICWGCRARDRAESCRQGLWQSPQLWIAIIFMDYFQSLVSFSLMFPSNGATIDSCTRFFPPKNANWVLFVSVTCWGLSKSGRSCSVDRSESWEGIDPTFHSLLNFISYQCSPSPEVLTSEENGYTFRSQASWCGTKCWVMKHRF